MDFISGSRLHNILQESINSFILTESQESKSIHAAKRRVMKRFNYDEEKAHDIINELRNTISSLKKGKCGKFVEGVARMYCDGQLRDTNIMSQLNTTLMYVASDAHINEYDKNLNELSAQELIDRFAANVEADLENDIKKIKQKHYTEPSEYEIVRIDSYEQATEYYHYTYKESRWCLTYKEDMYEKYTCGGVNQIYFCLKRGFENVEPIPGEGRPLDEYGLSMLSVIVNENGSLVHCTSRWNHKNGGNDDVMNTEQISDVIRMRFYDVFKPNNKWNEMVETAIQRLANGENPEDVFDECDYLDEGFMRVRLNKKWNFINQNGELVSKKAWFDYCGKFINGFATIELNGKDNFINQNGEILYKPDEPNQWFEDAYAFKYGFAHICLNNKHNYININGQFITELPTVDELIKGKWFNWANSFNEGFGLVCLGDKFNYIDQNGGLLSDQWFESAEDFKNGFAYVMKDRKDNIIYPNGELFAENGFDWCNRGIFDGYIEVHLNGKSNLINKKNGKCFSDIWFDNKLYGFHEGYMAVSVNKKYNFIDSNGNFLSDQWFDDCGQFNEGLAAIKVGDKWNFIDQNGELLSPNQWFDWCCGFTCNRTASVKLNGKNYEIDKHGNITNRSLGESYIRKTIYESIIHFIRNDRIQ